MEAVHRALVEIYCKLHPDRTEIVQARLEGIAPARILSLYPFEHEELGRYFANYFKAADNLLACAKHLAAANLQAAMPPPHLLPKERELHEVARLAAWKSIVEGAIYTDPQWVKSAELAELLRAIGSDTSAKFNDSRAVHELVRASKAIWYGLHHMEFDTGWNTAIAKSLRLVDQALMVARAA
jgi:hypothetical protein